MHFPHSRRLALALSLGVLALTAPLSRAAHVDVSSAENVRPALPKIPDRTFTLTDFGAVADGKTLNTEAFTKAIAAVDKSGGGRLVVPAGVFMTAPFTLCSNLDLHLADGAIIQAPDTFEALGLPDPATLKTQAEASQVKTPAPLITGKNLHDVALTGTGIIDGSGAHWWAWSERAARAQSGRLVYRRPHLVVITGCERLLVADITLRNSSMFHLVPKNITDLTIERVKVRAPWDGSGPNTDAIDPFSSSNVTISNVTADVGDDNIAIKSGRINSPGPDAPSRNITISDCTFLHGHGLSIGSELAGGAQTDNRVAIHSDRYSAQPLLIQGPGAGADVTAAALLDDVLRIAGA
jgi:polygalacturonase